jgi:large subunit ribosomal protein L25
MLTLAAKIRKEIGKKVKNLRKKDVLPAILYGHKTKNLALEISLKDFEKVYKEAGESSLITLDIEGKKEKPPVLIHEVVKDSMTAKPTHVDFYQPILEEEIGAKVILVFEGEAPAVKELGGTLVKNFSEIEVKALPQNLPKEIKVNVGMLKTFEDNIFVRDIQLPSGVKVQKHPDEIVALVTPPEKVEEELEKPIEEKVEEVEKVEEKKKEKEEEETGESKEPEAKLEKKS